MDKNPPEEAGADDTNASAGSAGAGPSAVSAGLVALLPLPSAEEVAGRPVLEQLSAAVHLAEVAASLALWPLSQDELG